jgi:soluble lytic murein transglycosylase
MVAALAGICTALLLPKVHHAVQEITLPLRHEDIIRQQASSKHLDPALIAAVIYTESHFRDQTSRAGAKGLMQITPGTARYIAHLSGGTAFRLDDLGTPQVNISYGAYYLRYLVERYGGNEVLALAAYNGGEGNVDRWIGEAGANDRSLRVDDIPFPETRAYVGKVEDAKREYRRVYRRQLGL